MNVSTVRAERPAPNYYRDHFTRLITTVHGRYSDLLNPSEQQMLQQWQKASESAQRLLIRLYLRKGPLFLADKLSYAEVSDTEAALAELISLGLIEVNPPAYAYELINLLPIQQSRMLFESNEVKPSKASLLEYWLDDEQHLLCNEWGVTDTIIRPLHYPAMRTFQLLYFGNERQSLTEFVLEDIGMTRYENYTLDPKHRLFVDRADIETYQAINDAADTFYLLELEKKWGDLESLAQEILALKPRDGIKHRWHRLLNRVGYRLEQCGKTDLALTLLQTNDTPPARERRVRILHKAKLFDRAQTLLDAIEINPKSADEREFHKRFNNKNRKALGLPATPKNMFQTCDRKITLPNAIGRVEQQTADFLGNCFWLENHLPLAVFGLVFWPVIFANTEGAWHHPFQSQPADLYDVEFLSRRSQPFQQTMALNKTELRARIHETWQQKLGISNAFVYWKALQLEPVLDCFDHLTLSQWHGVFLHLLTDLKHHRSGFPDLFQSTDQSYAFVEVKGPGDKLQSNQMAWLEKFHELNINAYVCYVNFDEP